MLPHGITVSELKARLSSAGVHPLFLLTDGSLDDAYQALVLEIGFGAAVAFDESDANLANNNDDYLPQAVVDGLEVPTASAHSDQR